MVRSLVASWETEWGCQEHKSATVKASRWVNWLALQWFLVTAALMGWQLEWP